MNILIVTDMEGVAGIVDFPNWCTPGGMYYEQGKRLLTEEVNSAVKGFKDGGADKIYVSDGHGYGGLNIELLDERVYYIKGGGPKRQKNMKDKWKVDVFAHVGQHAKSRTEYAHLPHTQSPVYLDETVNGVSIGEFGECAFKCSFLNIPPIFASGDNALCEEARALAPGMGTVSVKQGLTPGKGDECNASEYADRNTAAIHLQPAKARKLIYNGAKKAILRYLKNPNEFTIPFSDLKPPYTKIIKYRKGSNKDNKKIVIERKDIV